MSNVQSYSIPTYTWATRPASFPAGSPVYFSDAGLKNGRWAFDGSLWKPLEGVVLLGSLDAAGSPKNNGAATADFQYQAPAAFYQLGDRLVLKTVLSKSGTTDTALVDVRIGTVGTIAGDTQVLTGTAVIAANRTSANTYEFRFETANTIQSLQAGALGYYAPSATAIAGAVTIPNISNSLWFDFAVASGGASNTSQVIDAQLFLIRKAG